MSKKYEGKVRIPQEVMTRFKKHYPYHGDFQRVMNKLLVDDLQLKEQAAQINTQVGDNS